MSDDITQRLRAAVPKMPDSGTPIAWPCKVRSELLLEAAAEVERLRAENEKQRAEIERLRKALQDIAEDCDDDYPPSHGAIKYAVQDALRDKP